MWVHQGYSADTAVVDPGYIRFSIRAGNFLPDHTRPSHKNWSVFVGGWSAVLCECSFSPENKSISGSSETVENKKKRHAKKSRAHEVSRKEKNDIQNKKGRAHEIIEKKKTIYEIKKSCARDNRKEKTIYKIKRSCARDK